MLEQWDNIATDPEFLKYSDRERDTIRRQWFHENVETDPEFQQYSTTDKNAILKQFNAESKQRELEAKAKTENVFTSGVKDVGLKALQGVTDIPRAVVGLADMASGGRVGEDFERRGVDFGGSDEEIENLLSASSKLASREFAGADGVVDKIAAVAKNPRMIATEGARMVAPMLAMGAGGRAANVASGGRVSALTGAAATEGLQQAGSMAENIRQETGKVTPGQAAKSLASGALTSAFTVAGGRLANKLGLGDIESMLAGAGVKKTAAQVEGRIAQNLLSELPKPAQKAVQVAGGGAIEGFFEELPQSIQETIWENAALDRPLMDGVDDTAVMGTVLGFAMGGGANVFSPTPSRITEELGRIETIEDQAGTFSPEADTARKDLISRIANGDVSPLTTDQGKIDKTTQEDVALASAGRDILERTTELPGRESVGEEKEDTPRLDTFEQGQPQDQGPIAREGYRQEDVTDTKPTPVQEPASEGAGEPESVVQGVSQEATKDVDQQARSVADKFGITYNGLNEMPPELKAKGYGDQYTFTDPETKSTFTTTDLAETGAKLDELRERFGRTDLLGAKVVPEGAKTPTETPSASKLDMMNGRGVLPEAQAQPVEAPQKAAESPKKKAIGKAWDGGKWRPVVETNEIKRGKDNGKVRVTFPDGKKRVVWPKSLRLSDPPKAEISEAETKLSEGAASAKYSTKQTSGVLTQEEVSEVSKSIKEKHGLRYFEVYLRGDGNDLELNLVVVPKESRRKGRGKAAVTDLIEYADKNNKRLIVQPAIKDDHHGTTSRSRLVKFYKSLGFVENKGRNKDFALPPGLYREPTGTQYATKGFRRIYRGTNSYQKDPLFWTPDAEWSRQFTQSGRDNEIKQAYIKEDDIYTPASDVYAGDPDAVDTEVAIARKAGKRAVELDEGADQPRSIFVFDESAIKSESEYTGGQYQTRGLPALENVGLKEVQQIFKGQTAGKSADGSMWVKTKTGHMLKIRNVKEISEDRVSFESSYGRARKEGEFIAGSYKDGNIEITKGIGDKWTLAHESYHFAEDAGIVNRTDIDALNRALKRKKQDTTQENRARFVEEKLKARDYADDVPMLKRALKRIGDWVDSLANLFTRTARGVTRDIESGAIYDKGYKPAQNERGAVDIPGSGAFSQKVKAAEKAGYDVLVTHNGFEPGVSPRKREGAFEKFDGIFASYGDSSEYGNGTVETHYVLSGDKIAATGDVDFDYDKAISFLKSEYSDLSPEGIDRVYDLTAGDENLHDNPENNPLSEYGYEDTSDASWEYQNVRGKIAVDQGFDAVEVSDEFGVSVFIPYGSNAKKLSDIPTNEQFGPVDTNSKAFRDWFGDSAVADQSGDPLVVYHGTPGKPFNIFDKSKGMTGPISANPIAKYGFFFTDDRGNTDTYAGDDGAIIETYLSMQKPFVVDMWKDFIPLSDKRGVVVDEKVAPWVEGIKAKGHDGIILESGSGEYVYREFMVFEPTQIKSATTNVGTFDPTNPDIRYSTKAAADPFAKENAKIREKDNTTWKRAKRQLKRQLFPGGLLPTDVFGLMQDRDSMFNAVDSIDVPNLVGTLERAVKAAYGVGYEKLSAARKRLIQDALTGTIPGNLPAGIKTPVVAMREYIDGLSMNYAEILSREATELMQDGNDAAAVAKGELLNTVINNMGEYVHRSYRAFDDKKWYKNVPTETLNAAREYLLSGMQKNMSPEKAKERVEVVLNDLLKNGTAYDNFESFIKETKLGQQDLSILKKRKDIAPEIRALLGEYDDARINFAKTVTKMSRLVYNHRFLEGVKEAGEGVFLFTEENKPAEATAQIAFENDKTYEPLNGYWTTPEIAQSFKDALAKENMPKWLRKVVEYNGAVKFGKAQPLDATIYTPTGPVKMGDISVGDVVCGANGRANVTGVYPQGEMDVYRVGFSDGSVTEATEEHLWKIIGLEKKYTGVFTTGQVLGFHPNVVSKRAVAIPVATANFDARDIPIDPYLLGALLGDGCFRKSGLSFSTGDKEMVGFIQKCLPSGYSIMHPKGNAPCDYSIKADCLRDARNNGNTVVNALKDMGLWGHLSSGKFIPDVYKYNSAEVRLSIVQGLLDTDGWVLAQDGQPEFSTGSKRLAEDFIEVAESLGATALKREKITQSGNIGYEIRLRVENAKEWFRLTRKKDAARKRKKPVKRTLKSIERVGKKECQCIMVDDPDHLYLTDRFIVTHNTVLSPTTAARNWQSAMFFSLANGHFDMRHMKKSIDGLKEYFSSQGTPELLKYLRELKTLGVIYDTPYAGEMMQLLSDSQIDQDLISSRARRGVKKAVGVAQKFYQYGDDFWKIIGFENEKNLLVEAGLSEAAAKKESAERVRNTYPTYSMVGKFVKSLRRFPLAGTFVSFPAEIIRTQANMIRYIAKDLKSSNPKMKKLAMRRIAGMSVSAGMIYGLQAITRAMFGIDGEEDEAVRKLAAPWTRNSNIMYTGRDDKGNLQYIDLSFIDPYDYFKRPVMAIMRGQSWEDTLTDVLAETLEPFFGSDIAATAIGEVVANKRMDTGTRVYKEADLPQNQAMDIFNHLRKQLQPGVASSAERALYAMQGKVSASGKQYNLKDEAFAFGGWRLTTFDPKTSLYYRAFEFQDARSDASNVTYRTIRNLNKVSDGEIRSAYRRTNKILEKAYSEMSNIVLAAKRSGMTNAQITTVLSSSGVAKADIPYLLKGEVRPWEPSKQTMKKDIKRISSVYGSGVDITSRYNKLMSVIKKEGSK